jgi:hypothetical protein
MNSTELPVKRRQSDRDRELFNRCKETISGHWFDVRKSRCTFEQYLARSKSMQERLDYQGRKNLPNWRREALNAFNDGFYVLNQWEKVWVHSFAGRAYIGWDALPEAGKEEFRQNRGVSNHVWPGPEVVNGALITSLAPWGEWKS